MSKIDAKELIEKKLFKGYPQHELNYIDLSVKDIIELMEEYHQSKLKNNGDLGDARHTY